jgi:hypothetical protein
MVAQTDAQVADEELVEVCPPFAGTLFPLTATVAQVPPIERGWTAASYLRRADDAVPEVLEALPDKAVCACNGFQDRNKQGGECSYAHGPTLHSMNETQEWCYVTTPCYGKTIKPQDRDLPAFSYDPCSNKTHAADKKQAAKAAEPVKVSLGHEEDGPAPAPYKTLKDSTGRTTVKAMAALRAFAVLARDNALDLKGVPCGIFACLQCVIGKQFRGEIRGFHVACCSPSSDVSCAGRWSRPNGVRS